MVIYDGAGFHHRDGNGALPAKVRILNLPPYGPELNPVEKLWDILRDGICNRVFATLPQLAQALSAKLRGYWTETDAVLSLQLRLAPHANKLFCSQRSTGVSC